MKAFFLWHLVLISHAEAQKVSAVIKNKKQRTVKLFPCKKKGGSWKTLLKKQSLTHSGWISSKDNEYKNIFYFFERKKNHQRRGSIKLKAQKFIH